MIRIFLLLCLLVYTGTTSNAQVSPVQVIPSVLPPYSTLLSEYYSGDNTRLSVTLINTDFNEPQLKVYLRMTIEGQGVKLQSSEYGNYPSIELTPGLPVTVSQSDLAPYFNSQNLIVAASAGGLRPQVRLPEGYYQFSFEAIEVATKRVVGNKQSAQAYLTLSDPPFLTLPETGSMVPYTNPFNLLFQWTPRHLANPNAFNTEYQFDLVEIWDDGLAPQAAFYTSKPIYSTKTNLTSIFYGPGEPPLVVGKRYAWRVQATLITGNNDQEPFRNDGYSEIFWFKLQGDCPLLQKADIVSDPHNNKTKLSWVPDLTSVGNYKIDYRKKGASTWTTVDVPTSSSTLTGLSWNTDYEYRLGNRCVITDDFAYGGIQSFHTLNQDTTKCVPSAPKAISNTTGIESLTASDTIYAAGFRMRLTKVSGGNGTFSGEGYLGLLIPTTTTEVSVKASFQDISVNTDKELFAGNIVSMYDRNEAGIGNVDKIFEGGQGVGSTVTGATTAIAVDVVVDPSKKATISTHASANGGTEYEVTVTGTDDAQVTIKTSKLPVVIQDKEGKLYTVDKDGNIKPAGSAGAEQAKILAGKGSEELNALDTNKGTVSFQIHPQQTYALDVYQPAFDKSALFSQKYESLLDGKYRVSNKLLVTGSTDKVIATISKPSKDIDTDSIHFITGTGIELAAVKTSATTYEITLLAGPENDGQELYAVYRDTKAAEENEDKKIESSSFTYSLGKLNIATYAPKALTVTLVPVGTATIDAQQVQQKLNEIYNKVGVNWTVSKAASFTDMAWDANKDGRLDVKDAGKNNKYSVEMQALNNAYISSGAYDASTPYLFVFNTAPLNATATIQGDMLRNHQFGYLFTPLTDAGTVAAHELAHGMFHLDHTFGTQYKLKEGDLADNLMDYRNGADLVKLQWDAIHAPGLVIGVFEKEGDAQSVIVSNMDEFKDFKNESSNTTLDGTYTFITPSGNYITLPSDLISVEFSTLDRSYKIENGEVINEESNNLMPLGSLTGFVTKKGTYMYHNENGIFKGYTISYSSVDYYIDELTKQLKPTSGICLFIGVKNASFIGYVSKFKSPNLNIDYNSPAEGALIKSPFIMNSGYEPEGDYDKSLVDFLNQKKAVGKFNNTTNYAFEIQNNFVLWESKLSIQEFLKNSLAMSNTVRDYLFYFSIVSLKEREVKSYVRCQMESDPLFDFSKILQITVRPDVYLQMESYNDLNSIQAEFRSKTMEIISKQSGLNFMTISTLKALALRPASIDNAESIHALLENDGYKKCLLYSLSIDERLGVLGSLVLNGDTWTLLSENLLIDLLKTANTNKHLQILKAFQANQYAWINSMLSQDGLDATRAFLEFSNELNVLINQNYKSLQINPAQITIGDLNIDGYVEYKYNAGEEEFYIGGQKDMSYTLYDNFKITFPTLVNSTGSAVFLGSSGKIRLKQKYNFSDVQDQWRPTGQNVTDKGTWVEYNSVYDPFEPITLVFADNYLTIGFKKESRLVVPAYMSGLLLNAISNAVLEKNIQISEDIITIAATTFLTFATYGSSAPSALVTISARIAVIASKVNVVTSELTIATSAINIGIANERLTASSEQQAIYKAWDEFNFAVGVVDGLAGGASLAVSGFPKLPKSMTDLAKIRTWKQFNDICRNKIGILKPNLKAAWSFISTGATGSSLSTATDILKPITFAAPRANMFKTENFANDVKKLSFNQLLYQEFNDVRTSFFDKGELLFSAKPIPTIPPGGRNGLNATLVAVLEREGVAILKNKVTQEGLTSVKITECRVVFNKSDQEIINMSPASMQLSPLMALYKVTSATGTAIFAEPVAQTSTQVSPTLLYSSKLMTDELIENYNNNNCNYCRTSNKVLCKELEELKTRTANDAGVKALCASTLLDPTLLSIVLELKAYSLTAQKSFLTDLAGATNDFNNTVSLCVNINKLNTVILKAWKIVYTARGENKYKKDFILLQQIVSMKSSSNAVMYQNLGGDAVLTDIILKNVAAPCNTCDNNKDWHNNMAEYLKDVVYFVEKFNNTSGKSTVFTKGITSGSGNGASKQVFGAVYMLKVLRAEKSILPDQFEAPIGASNELKGCEPDAKIGAKILEFKSWSPADTDTDIGSRGSDEGNSVLGKSYFKVFAESSNAAGAANSYTQFLCYLNSIKSMEDLTYYFDKDFIETKVNIAAETYVRGVFQKLCTNPDRQTEIFNVIWNNLALRETLFPEIEDFREEDSEAIARGNFNKLVASSTNSFYNFITVK